MSDSEIAELIIAESSFTIGDYFGAAAVSIIIYEFLITFDREVELFWRRKITVSSVLFFRNRYIPLAANIFGGPWPEPASLVECKAFFWSLRTVDFFQYVPWAMFSGLRAYVLSSRRWTLATLVFILSLAPVFANSARMGYATVVMDPTFGCDFNIHSVVAVQTSLLIMSRAGLVVSDIVVVAVTWTATCKNAREMKRLGQETSLSNILFRDGVIYFTVLLFMNILHLVFSLGSILVNTDVAAIRASFITRLTEPITAILISRFLMNLQEANNGNAHQGSLSSVQRPGQVGSLNVNNMLGSIASSLPAPGEASPEREDIEFS